MCVKDAKGMPPPPRRSVNVGFLVGGGLALLGAMLCVLGQYLTYTRHDYYMFDVVTKEETLWLLGVTFFFPGVTVALMNYTAAQQRIAEALLYLGMVVSLGAVGTSIATKNPYFGMVVIDTSAFVLCLLGASALRATRKQPQPESLALLSDCVDTVGKAPPSQLHAPCLAMWIVSVSAPTVGVVACIIGHPPHNFVLGVIGMCAGGLAVTLARTVWSVWTWNARSYTNNAAVYGHAVQYLATGAILHALTVFTVFIFMHVHHRTETDASGRDFTRMDVAMFWFVTLAAVGLSFLVHVPLACVAKSRLPPPSGVVKTCWCTSCGEAKGKSGSDIDEHEEGRVVVVTGVEDDADLVDTTGAVKARRTWYVRFGACTGIGLLCVALLFGAYCVVMPEVYDLGTPDGTWRNPLGDVRYDDAIKLQTPQQVLVSVASPAQKTVVVSWLSHEDATDEVQSRVWIQDKVFTGTSRRFKDALLCPSMARLMHKVEVDAKALDLSQPTNYTVGYRSQRAMEGLKFPPSFYERDTSRPLRVALFGDLGTYSYHSHPSNPFPTNTSIPTMARLAKEGSLDMVLHAGDIAYNLDQDCGRVGDAFMLDIEPMASTIPYIVGPGNHEGARWLFGSYEHYVARYWGQEALGVASGSTSTRYFSVDEGLAHFVMLDASAWVHPVRYLLAHHSARRQMDWLYDDLANVDREKTPWVVVLVHRALYCVLDDGPECQDEAEALRIGGNTLFSPPGLEPAFLEFGVDVVISGHTHHYEREYPAAHGEVREKHYDSPTGVVHLQSGVAGGLGAEGWQKPMPSWGAFRDYKTRRGFVHSTFYNRTHADFAQMDEFGTIDSFTLVQEGHGRGFRHPE
eukprot:TRINITY_DN10371_c0_g1_i1.p1 TRINITY_DN10371_c0_g1~~TRINITY_DN10371_c0_g1_i1.p1  ORF type:complete len:854 (+),score=164.75 TRINITY_DN10371_c0_g1_i1:59-2620(+)